MEMNDYLKKAFNSLTDWDVLQMIDLILKEKHEIYWKMRGDVDFHNTIETLHKTEEKLGTLLANLIQRKQREK